MSPQWNKFVHDKIENAPFMYLFKADPSWIFISWDCIESLLTPVFQLTQDLEVEKPKHGIFSELLSKTAGKMNFGGFLLSALWKFIHKWAFPQLWQVISWKLQCTVFSAQISVSQTDSGSFSRKSLPGQQHSYPGYTILKTDFCFSHRTQEHKGNCQSKLLVPCP